DTADPVRDYRPSARPGARAPHVWLRRGEDDISTLDLFDTAPVLVCGPGAELQARAAATAANERGVPLRVHAVGGEGGLVDAYGEFPGLYGIGADGAVLVRPDGHVGWRARSLGRTRSAEIASAVAAGLARSRSPESRLALASREE